MRTRTYREPITHLCVVLPTGDDSEAFINRIFHATEPPVRRFDHVANPDNLYHILCQTEDLISLGDVVIVYHQLTPAMRALLDIFRAKFYIVEPTL